MKAYIRADQFKSNVFLCFTSGFLVHFENPLKLIIDLVCLGRVGKIDRCDNLFL